MLKRREKTTKLAALIIFGLAFLSLPFISLWKTEAAGTISGRVFQDFNGNGTYDTTITITNSGSGTTDVAVDRGVQNVDRNRLRFGRRFARNGNDGGRRHI